MEFDESDSLPRSRINGESSVVGFLDVGKDSIHRLLAFSNTGFTEFFLADSRFFGRKNCDSRFSEKPFPSPTSLRGLSKRTSD